MNLKALRLTGFFGIVAPLFGFMIIAMSIWLSPWFSWTGNALSDLGAEGFESVVFNSGLAMTAALLMMFSAGLLEMTKGDIIGQIGGAIHLLSAGLLIGIGVLNITIEPWHYYVSIGFFAAMPLSAAFIGLFCYRKKMRFYSLIAWGSATLAVVIWLLPWSSVAIPEALSAAYISVWQIIMAHWMYTRKEDKFVE
jgi:hypothetical membrane protein